jgi:[acyl-carrier-protein] S-malonyltransferase
MRPAAETLRAALSHTVFQAPLIEVVNNIDALAQTSAEGIREALYRQAYGPVRWVDVVRGLRARGAEVVVECGPGKVLVGLVKRTEPTLLTVSVAEPAHLDEVLALMQ